ncbi:MAG: sugar phosphate isomerase/epimerase [Anaerolineales bacterium]|nr:sugar phosphate isomerase/epimerase [Anaerolineales bacterium]
MKLAVTTCTPEVPVPVPVALLAGAFQEKLQKAALLGFDGVELMTLAPDSIDAAPLHIQLVALGLGVAAIATGAMSFAGKLTLLATDPAVSALAQARLVQAINLAAALGAPVVTVGSFRGRLATGGHNAYARVVSILHAAAIVAERRGVRLAIEPLNRYETDLVRDVEEGLALCHAVGSHAVGLLIDTFHANIEEPSLQESFRRAIERDRLFHVHIGDSNRLAPGLGHINFATITQVLCDTGYTGYLSAELLPQPDPDTAAALTIRHMRECRSRSC